ncbi:DNA-directed RNA polymerase III subunit RPC4 isoform X2 [Eupeodes corollae]|uniref:DNA-directed RNA polymerase III subunit RPC4 isoform X2 n=1 Tax=Eupeodes corollae TaxID=290404 RepID=UPI00249393B5|nr:DNA-directed RNA polymerase III subunit RPC4 isoform X2 [Eupeodes corollae]
MSAENAKTTFKSVSIKNEPMTLNGSADATFRLSSFSMPRDLTLGGAGRGGRGAGANKKVFTPNLNVTRNKNANVKTSKDTSARGRGRSDRGKTERGRGRGAARGGSNLIQTAGVFSEGAGALSLRKQMSSGYSRSDDAPSAMRKPTLIKPEGGFKIDVRAEQEHIRELLGDSDDDDFGDKKSDPDWVPIKLSEEKEKPDAIMQKIQSLHLNRTETNTPRYPLTVDDLLNNTQPQIFMMQLPDTLPCEDPDDSPENPPSTSKETQPPPPSEPLQKKNPLKDMVEGQIGKLVRYKSGKLKLVLGEAQFDVTMGIETGFLQDLMSISTNREERSGNMINLGPIQAKLTATPDWEYLLK